MAKPTTANPVPDSPKIFLPIIDNGDSKVTTPFLIDYITGFNGRDVQIARISDSHPGRARNSAANKFLETDCECMIMIDADIRFRRIDIDNLISHASNSIALVYGIYPKKEDATSPCLCTFNHLPQPDRDTGLAEVRRAGTGFVLIKREVLEALKEDNGGPCRRFHNHEKIEWDFFPSGVVEGEFAQMAVNNGSGDKDGFPVREWLSEDWYFSELARKVGYKTMVDSRIVLGHIGLKEYRFQLEQLARLDANIKHWTEIHGWFDYEDLYRDLAFNIPDGGTFLEIGCWLGRSIAAFDSFAKELGKKVKIHVVDTFKGEPGNEIQSVFLKAFGGSIETPFRSNMNALGVDVTVHARESADAAPVFEDESLDAVFIDGSHYYEDVKRDIAAWLPKVKKGGIISGHDFDYAAVQRAVKEVFGDRAQKVRRSWLVRL